jgi:hypothetical protein
VPRRKRRRREPGPLDVALAATVHDPRGGLGDELRRALPRLARLYRGIAVATSPPTAPRLTALLAQAGIHAGTPAQNLRGPLYRLAIRAALRTGAARVHYLDLDRVLHWLRRAPRELRATLRVARRHRILVVGRTPKAHRSHHLPLYATEVLVSRLMTERLGVAARLDLLVPSFVLPPDAAELLVARSRARDAAFYGEWAALLASLGPEVAYLECYGLDWETPDRHRRAVRRVGLPAWRRRQETPAEWARRIDMAEEFKAGFERALERFPVTRLDVRRLAPRAR